MEQFDFDFNTLFAQANGQPLYYKGRQIIMLDRIPANLNEKFLITIETTNSKYIQGIGIAEGVEIYGTNVKKAVIFENVSLPLEEREHKRSKLPFSFEIICKNKKGFLAFYNMAEVDGRQDWFNFGCAMMFDEIFNGRRYFCNDFQPNDDFNDLVFRVERL